MTLQLPVTLGAYTLEALLAKGGMAEVYRARDEAGKTYAVKVLDSAFARRRAVRARFEAESRALLALQHPNVIRVVAVGQEGAAYMVMELAEGGSLADWVARNGPMPPRLAVDVLLEICAGVQAAHEQGIVHRDLKPENVLIDANGRCKVADFGIAKFLAPDEASLTRTGTVLGTFAYMSPEQRRDPAHVDVRSDVYALGATLHALLTDRTETDLFTWDRDPRLLAGVPEPLVPALQHALAFAVADRVPSVAALAERLVAVRPSLSPVPAGTAPLGGRRRVHAAEPTGMGAIARPRTVLVTEDDPTMRKIVALVLGDAGYQVLLAEDGPSALKLADAYAGFIDLLIIDLVLPGEPGTYVATALGRARPGVPLLFMTGHSAERLVQRGIDLGDRPVLKKPFSPEQVLQAARRAMGEASGSES